MMPVISFFAQGQPKGQPRPKAFARKMGASWQARVYDPGTAEGWKGEVAIAAKPHIPRGSFLCALKLTLSFHLPRPKGHYFTGKRAGELRPDAPKFHASKPDADNFAKAVMDAMTLLGFWQDDSQIVVLKVTKLYANGPTGCEITISEPHDL